jgi:hypothetical protein
MGNELLRFARLAVATARRVVPPRLSRHAGPTYHPASLLAAPLLREHLRLTCRAAEGLLRLSDRLRRLLGLRIVPDRDLVPLAGAAHAVLPFETLVADAGYDSEANHRFCRADLGVDSLIPAKKRRSLRVVATTPYRRGMVERLGEAGDGTSRRAYRQRRKAETVMSVVKRRWGEALSARLDPTQETQALLRGVVYNLNRLVRLDYAA